MNTFIRSTIKTPTTKEELPPSSLPSLPQPNRIKNSPLRSNHFGQTSSERGRKGEGEEKVFEGPNCISRSANTE